MSGDRHQRVQPVNCRQCPEQLAGAPIDDHRYSILDQQISGEEYPLPGEPYHQISGGMGRAWMADDQGAPSGPESIYPGDRSVRSVGKGKAPHGIEADDSDPVGNQGVFATFGRQYPPVGVGDDLGAKPPENDGPKMMVGMMVRQDQPGNRLPGHPPDGIDQLLPLLGAGECIDDNNPVTGDHKACVRSPLRAPTGVTQSGVHARSELANRWWQCWGCRMTEKSGENQC